jgi:hypothetical protein
VKIFMIHGLGVRIMGLGFTVHGSGFRAYI